MAGKVDLGTCVSYGWERLKANPGYQILGGLAIGIVGGLTLGLLYGPLMVGYNKGMMKEDAGGKAEIGDIFSAMDRFVPSLIAFLLVFVVMMVASLIPFGGLVVSPMFGMSMYLIAKGESDGINALKTGFEFYKGDLLQAVLTSFVLGLVASLGFIACGVGAIATMPIALAGGFKLSQQLAGDAGKANLKAA